MAKKSICKLFKTMRSLNYDEFVCKTLPTRCGRILPYCDNNCRFLKNMNPYGNKCVYGEREENGSLMPKTLGIDDFCEEINDTFIIEECYKIVNLNLEEAVISYYILGKEPPLPKDLTQLNLVSFSANFDIPEWFPEIIWLVTS